MEVDLAKNIELDISIIINTSSVMSVINKATSPLKLSWANLTDNPTIDQTITNEFIEVNEAIVNNA